MHHVMPVALNPAGLASLLQGFTMPYAMASGLHLSLGMNANDAALADAIDIYDPFQNAGRPGLALETWELNQELLDVDFPIQCMVHYLPTI